MPPGFDAAAKTLGVSQEALMRHHENGGRQLDTAAAAKDLKVTEAALKLHCLGRLVNSTCADPIGAVKSGFAPLCERCT